MTSTSTIALLCVSLLGATASAALNSTAFTLNTYYTNFPGFGQPAINANGGSFWVGKPTSSYCPSSVANITTCPVGNVTSFLGGYSPGGLSLNTAVPGGQQVYVSPTGLLTYTVPHSGYMPPGSVTGGLIVDRTTSQLSKLYTFWLCNLPEDSALWRVWVEIEDENGTIKVGGQTPNNACTRFILIAQPVEGVGAWEYT